MPLFRVAGPYRNLQVKPRFFSGFLDKNIILCILKGEMPFKMHKIIFFSSRKKKCVPILPKMSRLVTRNTLSFLFGLLITSLNRKKY